MSFGRSPEVSIDYAVMEKAERVAVMPVEIGWSDVDSWDALHELAIKDGDGNAHHDQVVAIDTSSCLIRRKGPLVAAVAFEDLIISPTRTPCWCCRAVTASRSSARSTRSIARHASLESTC